MQTNITNQQCPPQGMHNSTVSIGMPVYNGENFIREALDSILVQTFTDFELIISDNASTDTTETICREYATRDQRIRYIRQPVNQGALYNFKFVLDEAHGKYFKWMAHDDYLYPQFLEMIVHYLECHLDVVSCTSDTMAVGGQYGSGVVTKLSDVLGDDQDWTKVRGRFILSLSSFFNAICAGSSYVVYGIHRKTLVKEFYDHFGYMKRILTNEFPFLAHLALQGRIVVIEPVLWAYRFHPDSLSASNTLYNSFWNRYLKHNLLTDIYTFFQIIHSTLNSTLKIRLVFRITTRQLVLFLSVLLRSTRKLVKIFLKQSERHS